MNIYYDPQQFGLETVGSIQWGEPCWDFDLTVVFKRLSDGAFVYGEDSGCSCPSPFEDQGVQDLTVLPSRSTIAAFQEHCNRRAANRDEDAGAKIANLVELMLKAGAR